MERCFVDLARAEATSGGSSHPLFTSKSSGRPTTPPLTLFPLSISVLPSTAETCGTTGGGEGCDTRGRGAVVVTEGEVGEGGARCARREVRVLLAAE